MATVTVSPKYQVIIPEEMRSKLKLKPRQKVVVLEKDGIIYIIPLRPIKEMKGFVKDIDTKGIRDEPAQLFW